MKTVKLVMALSVLFALGALPSVAAEVKMLVSNVFKDAVVKLEQPFHKKTGNKLSVVYGTTGAIKDRLKQGETPDLIFVSAEAMEDMAKTGQVVAGSNATIARTGVGIVIRSGASKPDIGSVEAFKKTLMAAKSIAASDPKDGGTAAVHFAKVLEKLGLADELKPKLKLVGKGINSGDVVAKGEAEIGVNMITELLRVPGADYVGPFPAEVQNMMAFAGGVGAKAKNPDAGKAFLQLLVSAQGKEVMKATGLEPTSASK